MSLLLKLLSTKPKLTLLPLLKSNLCLPKLNHLTMLPASASRSVPASDSRSVPAALSRLDLTRSGITYRSEIVVLRSTSKLDQFSLPKLMSGEGVSHLFVPLLSRLDLSRSSITVSRCSEIIVLRSTSKLDQLSLPKLMIGDEVSHLFMPSLSRLDLSRSSIIVSRCSEIIVLRSTSKLDQLSPPKLMSGDGVSHLFVSSLNQFISIRSPVNTGSSLVKFPSNALVVSLIRKYKSYPQMMPPKVEKPEEAIDCIEIKTHRSRYDQVMYLPEETIPEAVMEMKYAACASFTGSTVPKFRVHNLRASSMVNNEVFSIIDRVDKAAIDSAKKEINNELKANDIDVNDLKKIWYADNRSAQDFWAYSKVKHSKYSKKDQIGSYASLIHKLAADVLTGPNTLGEFLEKKGFVAGEYHETKDLLVALKEYFGKDAYPTFICQEIHPSLFEVAVLSIGEKIIHHPLVSTVLEGKFLMRKI